MMMTKMMTMSSFIFAVGSHTPDYSHSNRNHVVGTSHGFSGGGGGGGLMLSAWCSFASFSRRFLSTMCDTKGFLLIRKIRVVIVLIMIVVVLIVCSSITTTIITITTTTTTTNYKYYYYN